jgi:hypothetical protein
MNRKDKLRKEIEEIKSVKGQDIIDCFNTIIERSNVGEITYSKEYINDKGIIFTGDEEAHEIILEMLEDYGYFDREPYNMYIRDVDNELNKKELIVIVLFFILACIGVYHISYHLLNWIF